MVLFLGPLLRKIAANYGGGRGNLVQIVNGRKDANIASFYACDRAIRRRFLRASESSWHDQSASGNQHSLVGNC